MMRNNGIDGQWIEQFCPLTKLKIYGNGCYEAVRESKIQGQTNPFENSVRGKITKMTNKSISRLILTAQATPAEFQSMVTLSYPRVYPTDGAIVKADVGYITQWLRKQFMIDYLWFLEFQQRGAPHIHILLTAGPDPGVEAVITPRMRVLLALRWTERVCCSDWFQEEIDWLGLPKDEAQIVAWQMMSVVSHRKSWELIKRDGGARRYVTKYAAKAYQKIVPKEYQNVGRFWGCSKAVRPEAKHTIDVTDEEVRTFLEGHKHIAADWELLPKYIFNVKDVSDGQPNGATSGEGD